MTARFMVDDAGTLIDIHTRDTFDYVSDVCNLLNEQHETIHRLKQNIDELLSVDIEEELLKENEQLKKEAEEYNEDAMSYQTLYEQQLETIQRLKQNIEELLSINVEKELLEENERLRKAVDNCQFRTLDLLDYIKEKETVTHQEIKDWWNNEVEE